MESLLSGFNVTLEPVSSYRVSCSRLIKDTFFQLSSVAAEPQFPQRRMAIAII
jgi:hypothetical protein